MLLLHSTVLPLSSLPMTCEVGMYGSCLVLLTVVSQWSDRWHTVGTWQKFVDYGASLSVLSRWQCVNGGCWDRLEEACEGGCLTGSQALLFFLTRLVLLLNILAYCWKGK
jgi:hypothetical protein